VNQLRLLGDVDLRASDGRRVDSILSQPKRLALLAVLALSEGGRLQRDELIGLFWPELPEARARRALSQALHYLRRSLGPNVVDGKYETGIGISGVACDACALLRAARDGRHAEALELYAGELLPGFHVDGAPPELEHWLSAQRTRVRNAAADSAWTVAEDAAVAGDAIRAGKVARRAYALSPWGEPAVHRLLTLLLRIGDRAGALRAYDTFEDELRQEYGSEPSEATRALLERASADAHAAAGADVVPPATSSEAIPEAATMVSPAPRAVPAPPPALSAGGWLRRISALWPRPLPAVWTAIVLLAVLFPALWLSLAWGSEGEPAVAAPTPEENPTLYLESVRDLEFPDPAPGIAEAVTSELMARLAETRGYQVVTSASRVQNPHGLRLRPTLRRDGDRLRLAMLLVDPASEAVLDEVVVESEEPLGIETPGHLAEELSLELRKQIADHLYLSRLAARGVDSRVLSALQAGTAEASEADSLRRGRSRAAAMIAYRSADSLFAGAQRAAPEWPEPGVRRAELALRTQWMHLVPPHYDPAAALEVLQTGLTRIDEVMARFPENPDALEVRGVLRYWAGLLTEPGEERTDLWTAARSDLQASVHTDPARVRAWVTLSAMAERRGDFTDAYLSSRRAFAADRDLEHSTEILVRLFSSALEIGDTEGAAGWCAEAHRRLPDYWLGTYCDLSRLAWAGPWSGATADSMLAAVESKLPPGPQGDDVRGRMQLLRAVVLARSGDRVGAEAVLAREDAPQWPSPEMLALEAWTLATLGRCARWSTPIRTRRRGSCAAAGTTRP
jgi:DNA-binding SARP family transcriptional activator